MVQHQPAGRARQHQILDDEEGLPGRRVVRSRGRLDGADHLGDDPRNVDIGDLRFSLKVAIPQHGDIVADAHDLFEAVGDVDDRDAALLEVVDDVEQGLHLGAAQRRAGLVHDEHAHLGGQRLGDLDDLLFADAQVVDQFRRVDGMIEAGEELARQLRLTRAVDIDAEAGRRVGQQQVFRDREVRAEVQFLENDADAVAGGVAHRTEADRLAIEQDATEGRLLGPGENLHQRRLAGAVLADQHVDRAGTNAEVDTAKSDRAGIDLHDLLGPHDDLVGGCGLRGDGHWVVPPMESSTGVMVRGVPPDGAVAAPENEITLPSAPAISLAKPAVALPFSARETSA